MAKEGNPQDIKLNIDVEQEFNKIGDAINDGKRQALEQLEKEKERWREAAMTSNNDNNLKIRTMHDDL